MGISMRQLSRFCAALFLSFITSGAVAETAKHPITIEDVLGVERIDSAVFAPDGEWAAVVVRRAASAGEVYGRTAFEIDPGRSDIWLVSAKTGERRPITDGWAIGAPLGRPTAAGSRCSQRSRRVPSRAAATTSVSTSGIARAGA
jgi:hypothetical protein